MYCLVSFVYCFFLLLRTHNNSNSNNTRSISKNHINSIQLEACRGSGTRDNFVLNKTYGHPKLKGIGRSSYFSSLVLTCKYRCIP